MNEKTLGKIVGKASLEAKIFKFSSFNGHWQISIQNTFCLLSRVSEPHEVLNTAYLILGIRCFGFNT